jgi:hypothetical protein
MAMPTSSDLSTFLGTIPGLDVPSGVDLASAVADATADFYNRSGRGAFVGDTGTTAVPKLQTMMIGRRAIVEIPDMWAITEVRADYTGTAGTGTVLSELSSYRIWPENRSIIGKPAEAIELMNVGQSNLYLLVTGKLGYSADCPAQVFRAILKGAAATVLAQIQGATGPAMRLKQGAREVQYDNAAGRSTYERLQAEFQTVASQYMRMPYV